MSVHGIELVIHPNSEKKDVMAEYHAKANRKAEAYSNSEAAEEARRQKAMDQQRVNALVDALPDAIKGGEAAVVKWVGDFSKVNENMELTYDKAAIAEALKSAGYKNDDRVDDPAVKTDPTALARWLVGQAIKNLESGMPIDPMSAEVSEDYERLTGGRGWLQKLGIGKRKGPQIS